MRRVVLASLVAVLVATGCANALDRARKAEAGGDYREAEDLYERAAYDPKLGKTAKGEYANFLAERGAQVEKSDPVRAEEYYGKALRVQPGHDQALTRWVRMLRKAGRTQEAVDVVDNADQDGNCGSCKRLRLVLLLEQGDQAMANKEWDAAIEFYTKAQERRRQAAPEMAIALAHLQAGRNAEALERLAGSIALVEADPAIAETFVRIRGELLSLGLTRDNLEIVDEVRTVSLPGEAASVRYEMALRVADHVRSKGNRDDAMTRYAEILADDKLELTAEHRTAVESRMLTVYRLQISVAMRDGRATEADQTLQKALELRPDDMGLRLQRLLAVAPTIGAEVALAGLEKLPAQTKGIGKVKAALLSLRASEQVDAGDLDFAQALVGQAEEFDKDAPEVHLALAEVVSRLPAEDLTSSERRALRRSMVAYGNNVRRFAEALGELDLAKSQRAGLSPSYEYYTPWFKPRAEALDAEIRKTYPYDVEFRAEPEPLLVFENPGEASINLDLFGPDGFEDAYELVAGTSQDVTLPDAGLLRLVVDGERLYFFAESYAKVTVRL